MTRSTTTALVDIVLNSRAGGGSGGRMRSRIERECARRRIPIRIEETRGRGHAVELARNAAERGAETVVAAGGDGTIHEVANGLLSARIDPPKLGIVPIGTGNDFIKAIEGFSNRDKVFAALDDGLVHRLDVGHVTWEGGEEYFINGMGTGIDVEVVRRIERYPRLPGRFGYLTGLLGALVRFRALPLTVRLDDRTLSRVVMIIAIGNGPCLGGGFFLCPDARPDDGRFDVCIVHELNALGVARVLPRILRGTHGALPEVESYRASAIELETTESPLFFHMDGELRESRAARRLRIELRPRALAVLAPAKG